MVIGRPRGWVHLPAQSGLRSKTVQCIKLEPGCGRWRESLGRSSVTSLVGCEIINQLARINSGTSLRSTEYILEPNMRARELVLLLGARRFSSGGC